MKRYQSNDQNHIRLPTQRINIRMKYRPKRKNVAQMSSPLEYIYICIIHCPNKIQLNKE